MIDYGQLEDSVVSMLSSLISIAEVIKNPENQSGLPQPVAKPRIIVAYRESEYKALLTSDGQAQEEKVYFNVEISGKKLNGNSGIRTLATLCKGLLLGQYPSHSGVKLGNAIAFHRSGMSEIPFQDSIWTYIIIGYITTMAIQMDIEETEILIRQITIQTEGEIEENFIVPDDINPQ